MPGDSDYRAMTLPNVTGLSSPRDNHMLQVQPMVGSQELGLRVVVWTLTAGDNSKTECPSPFLEASVPEDVDYGAIT